VGKTIQVTSAQVNADRLWMERADLDGTPIPDAIRKLAHAKPRPVIREPTATHRTATDGAATSDGATTTGQNPPPDADPPDPDKG
jgi:hypothetical protein